MMIMVFKSFFSDCNLIYFLCLEWRVYFSWSCSFSDADVLVRLLMLNIQCFGGCKMWSQFRVIEMRQDGVIHFVNSYYQHDVRRRQCFVQK